MSEPITYRLFPESGDAYFNFWIENRNITLSGHKNKFSELAVQGSPLNKIAFIVDHKHHDLDMLRDSLAKKAINESDENKAVDIWKQISTIDNKVKNTRLQTIASFKPSLVTIKELFFLRNDLTKDSLKIFFDKFPASLRMTKYGDVISQYILTDELKVGVQATDVIGKDFNGKEVKLSDLKNKVVLLDFWASWCGPCRKSNKDLAELLKKYKNDDFEIISFSLDTNENDWKLASHKDSITWTNISDLKGLYSRQAASYKIRAIPKSFLIDKNGTIVKIFTGYSKEGKSSLETIIKRLVSKTQEASWNKEIYTPCLDTNNNEIKIINNYGTIASIHQLLDSFKGKPVFIDLWATWCGPCLEEFKFSRPLYNFLNKNKIEIIYVSFDKEQEDNQWREMVRENNLSGNHIRASKLLRDDITILLWGAIDAFSIPRYLLFDSEKRLINKNTSPPSEGVKLFKEIEQGLKQLRVEE